MGVWLWKYEELCVCLWAHINLCAWLCLCLCVCVAADVLCLRYVHLNRAVSLAGSLAISHFVVCSADASDWQRFVCVLCIYSSPCCLCWNENKKESVIMCVGTVMCSMSTIMPVCAFLPLCGSSTRWSFPFSSIRTVFSDRQKRFQLWNCCNYIFFQLCLNKLSLYKCSTSNYRTHSRQLIVKTAESDI